MNSNNFSPYTLTYDNLLFDLYLSFYRARKYKKKKPYVISFEADLDKNIHDLCDELYNRTYIPLPSTCFVITHPKLREVFAAQFRDRVVHHLYFNYTYPIFYRTFIQDSYSCIEGRGTHYGIERLEHHIRQESENYTKPCYILKLDIKGYFIHINRNKLCDIALTSLEKMKTHKSYLHGKVWEEVVDYDFTKYLTKEISLLDPTINCNIKGGQASLASLPDSKSLFKSPADCGLPIGNLTSQLFSNVYLNVLDQYCKTELHCKHYGRYVDDFYVVSKDRSFLHDITKKIRLFLKNVLDLELQEGKVRIYDAKYGVDFLGAFIKPYRNYVSNDSLRHMKDTLWDLEHNTNKQTSVVNSVNSLLGVFSHYNSFNVRKDLFSNQSFLNNYGWFNNDYSKFIPF